MGMFDHRRAGRDWHYREAPVRLMSVGRSSNSEISELRRFEHRVCFCQQRTCTGTMWADLDWSEAVATVPRELIPTCTDYDPRAHLRRPMVMMRHG